MGLRTAVVSGDRRDWVRRASVTRKMRTKMKRDREGAMVAWKHTRRYGEKLGRFACLSARPCTGYLYESKSAAI